jgi:hypothetical protein
VATKVPLPRYNALPELVIFHREHPAEPQVILQVPTNEDRTDSQTYIIRMDNEADVGWVEGLPNSRDLRDLLTMTMHVAYCPRTGHTAEIDDLDMPTRHQLMLAEARFFAQPAAGTQLDRAGRTLRQMAARENSPISRLRYALGAKLPLPRSFRR